MLFAPQHRYPPPSQTTILHTSNTHPLRFLSRNMAQRLRTMPFNVDTVAASIGRGFRSKYAGFSPASAWDSTLKDEIRAEQREAVEQRRNMPQVVEQGFWMGKLLPCERFPPAVNLLTGAYSPPRLEPDQVGRPRVGLLSGKSAVLELLYH